jgi:hypothetical protein
MDGLSANHVRSPKPVVPVVPPIHERFAKLVPEFAGAYRGDGNSLVVRVSDLNFSRTGSAAIARALLENELKASGRGELTVTFEPARYDYNQLRTWLALCLDSLGTYKPVSWSIYQRTSQIRVGFANESALSGFKSAVAKLGIPSDAVLLGLEPEDQLYQGRLDTLVRPEKGGLVIYTHQWHYDGAATGQTKCLPTSTASASLIGELQRWMTTTDSADKAHHDNIFHIPVVPTTSVTLVTDERSCAKVIPEPVVCRRGSRCRL